jgi:RNA polymerase sigma-70 factor, ECF subfamily
MQLYEPVHARLSRFVQTIVWNRDDAKDVISETVLITFEKFEKVTDPEKFLYFLFGVATNVVRKKNRRKKFWGVFSEEQSEQLPDEQLADDRLLRKELHDALQKLKGKQREAIVLFEISGFSIKEIAQMQGLSESGVKSNLKRGKEKLAGFLTDTSQTSEYTQLQVERSRYGK